MAIQKKSIAQIAKENNINLSEENAQKVLMLIYNQR